MNDKLEQLYNLYKQNGIIQSTDFNTFSTADDNQKKKLYDLGKQKGLFKTTDYNTFSSAFSPVKKKNLRHQFLHQVKNLLHRLLQPRRHLGSRTICLQQVI